MECATEMVPVQMNGMQAPCSPSSPQSVEKVYQEEDDVIMCDANAAQLSMGMAPMKGGTPQMHAVPQMYAQYYPYSMPQANTGPYGPTVMYMPMYYPQQYRTGNSPGYAVDYTTAAATQPSQTQKTPVELPTIVKTPGRQRVVIWNFCQFCQNNKESESYYRNHILRDAEGRVVCPVLRAYNCPICNNGGGDNAHTKSYCPQLRTSRLPRRGNLF